MIRSFRHKGLKRLYEQDDQRGVISEHCEKLRYILARLDASASPDDMIFRFVDSGATDVDSLDYH